MAHLDHLRGEHENRRTKRGIRRGRLRVKPRARRGKRNDERGLFYQGRTRGKHLKSTRSRLYRGA